MTLRPGDVFHGVLITTTSSGATDVDVSTVPTFIADHNGSDDSSFTFTYTRKDTGRYAVSGTVPSGYAAGDNVNVIAVVTLGGLIFKNRIDFIQIDTMRASDIPPTVRPWLR